MIKPFNDDHVSLSAESLNRECDASKPSKVINRIRAAKFSNGFRSNEIIAMAEKTLVELEFKPLKHLGKPFEPLQNQTEFQYTNNGRFGYIRVGRCFSTINLFYYTGPVNEVDQILEEFGDIDGLIIDARFNVGGLDPYCEKIAGRFIKENKKAYLRQTRNGGHEDFTEPKPFYIKPRGRSPFLKPVALLTNDQTVSAGDLFALIMSDLPQVTLIGENSNGSFSTILEKTLSNGWELGISNQRYTSADGINYEGSGVPVDIEVFNTTEDFINGEDRVIKTAFYHLKTSVK